MFIIYGQIGPALCSKGQKVHNFGIGLHVHVPLEPCTQVFSLHEWKQRRRFLNMWYFFAYLSLSPKGGKVTAFTIQIFLIIEILQTERCNNWSCSFQEDVKISDRAHPTHDDGRRPNATCHLIDSGDLKRKPLCCIYFRQKMSENQVIVN